MKTADMGKIRTIILAALTLPLISTSVLYAQDGEDSPADAKSPDSLPHPGQVVDLINKATSPEPGEQTNEWSAPVKLAIVFALLAILPALLVMMTSFTRIVIVLAFIRRALTTQNIPPTIAIIGLALFLTLYTMSPTLADVNTHCVRPYLNDQMTFADMCDRANNTLKSFMYRQTRMSDLQMFWKMSGSKKPESVSQIPSTVMIPAFAVSEFRKAFEMGALMFIPFLLVDLVTAGILLSAGMMMLPPVIISLPFKIILFVLVDGWSLLARTLVTSFR